MKKIIALTLGFGLILLSAPYFVFAISTSVDRNVAGGYIQPLISSDYFQVDHLIATSSTATSSINSGILQVSDSLSRTNVGSINTVGGYTNNCAFGSLNSVLASDGGGFDVGSSCAYGISNTINSTSFQAFAFGRGNNISPISFTSGGLLAVGVTNTINPIGGGNSYTFGIGNSVSGSNAGAVGEFITNSTSNSLMIGPSDASKLTILSTGRVGIGSTTPGTALSLGSNSSGFINLSTTSTSTLSKGINILGGCYAVNGTCLSTGGSGLVGITGQLPYFTGTNTAAGTSTLFLSTAGNFGIGTTTPSSALTVQSSGFNIANIFDSNRNSVFRMTGSPADFNGQIEIGDNDTLGFGAKLTIDGGQGVSWFNGSLGVATGGPPDASLALDVNGTIGNSRGALALMSASGSAGSDITITAGADNSGSVAPDGSVHINGGNALYGGNTYIGDTQSGNTFISNAVFTSDLAATGFTMDSSEVSQLNIYTQSNTTAAANLYLTAAEGISTNPDGSVFIQTEGPGPWGVGSINLEDNSGGGINIDELGAGDISFSSTHRFLFSGGNIGIGSTTPTAKFSVQSNSATTTLFSFATSTSRTLFRLDPKGNQYTGGDLVTVTSCGSGATVATGSNNNSGRIKIGSTALQSTCTVTYADGGFTSTGNAPSCSINIEGGLGIGANASTTATGMVITPLSGTNFPNDTFTWQCSGF